MKPRNSLKENWKLVLLNLRVKKWEFREYCKVVKRYYKNKLFRKIDLALIRKYFFKNAFKVSKEFLLAKEESEIYAYGETPLTTLEEIARHCTLSSADTLYELGSGRGRSCFWLNCFVGCKVVGIDYVPQFIEKATQIKEQFHLKDIEFRQENFLHTDFRGATTIYLYGTLLDEPLLRKLVRRFSHLPKETKFITVSYPLNDFVAKPLFEEVKVFPASFNWGETEIYLQKLIT